MSPSCQHGPRRHSEGQAACVLGARRGTGVCRDGLEGSTRAQVASGGWGWWGSLLQGFRGLT